MDKKPSPIWHMIKWGLLSGIILSSLFMMAIVGLLIGLGVLSDLNEFLEMSLREYLSTGLFIISVMSILYGGIPGVILGLIDGLAIRHLLQDVPVPFTEADLSQKRRSIYRYIFFIPIVIVFFFGTPVVMNDITQLSSILFTSGLPSIIAGIVSVYAAHRYLLRLQSWSENVDIRKAKAKREWRDNNRLLDKAIDEAYVIPEIKVSEQIKRE